MLNFLGPSEFLNFAKKFYCAFGFTQFSLNSHPWYDINCLTVIYFLLFCGSIITGTDKSNFDKLDKKKIFHNKNQVAMRFIS